MGCLPDCLTKFNQAGFNAANVALAPKHFYEVVMSRPVQGMRVSENECMMWSHVPPHRCVLSHSSLEDHINKKFKICVLREFDQLP